MIRLRFVLAAALAVLFAAFAHGQSVEFGNVQVVQNDSGNAATSVTLFKGAGSSPNFSIEGGNRGDYDVSFGAANDVTSGVMMTSISQNGRDNTAAGDTIGLFYATSGSDSNGTSPLRYWVPIFRTAQGDEVNINFACAWFPYSQWLGGVARNASGTNGGANDALVASPGITLGTHFVDNGGGVSTVNLKALGANSANGVLLVTGAKNEDNYALSRANADGTFTAWVHDNGVNSNTYEQDYVSFVYLPVSGVGSNRLVALGRVNSNATTDVSGGNFTLTKGGTGQWYLTIPGQSATTGVLMISPEGGGTNNSDNVVSYEWQAANNRWVIESRDLSGATVQPTLQNGSTDAEDMFSFAFLESPGVPSVAITTPALDATFVAPGAFTVAATATDANGTITQVEFLRNGVVVSTDTSEPYISAEANLPAGRYTLTARATDNSGYVSTSDPVVVTVNFNPNSIPPNTALQFDGVNDYVTMGVASELGAGGPPTNGLTLECWFRKEGTGIVSSSGSGGVSGVPLFGKGRGEGDGSTIDCDYFFGISTAGVLVADFETYPATGLTTGQNYPITASNPPIQNDVWHHAAVTYDGASRTWLMYLDGQQVGTATAAAGALPRYDTIQHFGIGAAFNSTGVAEGAFAGVIDEVRVWNYARSAAEIVTTMNQELGSGIGLIGRFGLNEGTGTAASSSTAATTGTLTNGPVWVNGAPFTVANSAPNITLTAPVNGATSFHPVPVTLEATAADAGGSVAKVEFRVNGAIVGEDSSAPYAFTWTPPAVGSYTVSARAVDSLGASAVSATATISITVNPNQPPVVTPALPADGATVAGNSANLSVNLSDPEGDAMTVTFYGRATTPPAPGPAFSIVAIPDTQFYSEGAASHANTVTVQELVATFGKQTQWVLDNKTARNIAFVSHMGDLVQTGNNGGNDIEWQRASAAMGKLENPVAAMRAHGMPFGLAPGNHDIDPIGNYDGGSTSFFNQFFNRSRFAGRGYWGGSYGTDNTNNYQLFSASGLDFIAIHLSYDTTPNQPILDWADALLKAHPHRRAIVTSHWIVGAGNPATFSAQGAAIYNELKDNPNLFLMLCGHIHAEGRRADVFEGRTVYSMLQDYQSASNGGNGFLRIYNFSPANNRITVESYSPTLGRAVNASDSVPSWSGPINLAYNMQVPVMDWVPLATVSVPAGSTTATGNWTGLELGRNFEWYAAVTDGVSSGSSVPRRFSTVAGNPPVVSLDTPATGATFSTPAAINFTATASDPDGTVARVEFYAAGTKVGEDTDAPYAITWTGAVPGAYALTAVAVDNSNLATLSNVANVTVSFGDFPPTVSLTSPAFGAVFQAPANITLTANAADTEAAVVKVEFFSDDVLIGEDTTAPYSFVQPNVGPGSYVFTARVTDTAGQTVTSEPMDVSVFTEASVPSFNNVSVGLFNPPSWVVAQTTAAPRHFNLPGSDVGDLELRINGNSVPFAGGITLCSNWDNAGNGGIVSDDNISQPYADTFGNVFISVLDNSNNNAADGNPSTTEQTSGVGVAFLPFADGWTGASVNAAGTVLSGNLPAGVTVVKAGSASHYTISGLSTAGNLIAVCNGDTGTLADNVLSVRIASGRWAVDLRDNAGGGQNNDFSFVYIPPATPGVYAGAISSTGVVSSANAPLSGLGVTVNVNAGYYELTFGDGSVINPSTAALFVVADSAIGGAASNAADNLVSWSGSGNKFRVFTQDLPELNGNFEAIPLRFVAIPFTPQTNTLARGPYLQKAAPTKMTVRWRTTQSSVGRVQYGATVGNLDQTASESAAATDHEVTLTGLTPNTTYFYSVGSPGEVLGSGVGFTFTTPPATGAVADTRIWVLGDAGTGGADQTAVRDAFQAWTGARTPNVVLQLGNNTPGSGLDGDFQAGMFDPYATLLRKTPFWSTLGNQETANATAFVDSYPYFGIYSLPSAGECGGLASGTEHYYSWDHGNIHFISLDSMTANRSSDGPMATWLANDLANTSATWIICFFHHPPYSKGSFDSDTGVELSQMRQNLLPILEAGGVDLVLSAHSHSYERSYLLDGYYGASSTLSAAMKLDGGNGRAGGTGVYLKPLTGPRDHFGTVYAVAGSAGQIGGGLLNHPAHAVSLNALGSLVLDVNGSRLDATFVKSDGTTPDTFTILKQGAADSDGDRMSDDYELTYGFDRHNPADAVLDRDGDGLNNLEEFLAGTNPKNAADSPRVAGLAPQPDGSIVLQIPTTAGKSYRVEANNSFPTGSWNLVADHLAGTGSLVPVPDPGAAGISTRIYRVTVLP